MSQHEEIIRRYVRHQEITEQTYEQQMELPECKLESKKTSQVVILETTF
jgi:hypothetical protein